MDFLLTDTDELIRGVRTSSCLSHRGHVLVEFHNLRDMGQMKTKVTVLNCSRFPVV